jgi:hypothetical protein
VNISDPDLSVKIKSVEKWFFARNFLTGNPPQPASLPDYLFQGEVRDEEPRESLLPAGEPFV